jgi:hypothetical protein
MQKPCFKCGVVKPLDDFYRHPAMADGRLGKCKECTKADVRAARAARLEYYRAYDRERASLPKRRANVARVVKSWTQRHPRRAQAHSLVHRAIERGEISKPEKCEWCGGEGRIEGHHHDYTEPLAVTWLCKPCHCKADAMRRKAS